VRYVTKYAEICYSIGGALVRVGKILHIHGTFNGSNTRAPAAGVNDVINRSE